MTQLKLARRHWKQKASKQASSL